MKITTILKDIFLALASTLLFGGGIGFVGVCIFDARISTMLHISVYIFLLMLAMWLFIDYEEMKSRQSIQQAIREEEEKQQRMKEEKQRTIRQLDALNIPHVGTYLNAAARDTLCPQLVDVKGIRMAMMSYTYGTNGIPVQGKVVVDYINRERIAADIARARELNADVICVCMHWGIEYKMLPVDAQRSLADFLVEQGVDLIIGSHPHVVEPMEIRHSDKWNKDVLLVYSLGNFISNQNGTDSRGGALVKATLNRDLTGKVQLENASYRLFFCQKPKNSGENYQLIPYGSEHLLRTDSKAAYNAFMLNAHNILNKHNINVPEITNDSTSLLNYRFPTK